MSLWELLPCKWRVIGALALGFYAGCVVAMIVAFVMGHMGDVE